MPLVVPILVGRLQGVPNVVVKENKANKGKMSILQSKDFFLVSDCPERVCCQVDHPEEVQGRRKTLQGGIPHCAHRGDGHFYCIQVREEANLL